MQSFEPGSLKYMRSHGLETKIVQLIDGDGIDFKTGKATYNDITNSRPYDWTVAGDPRWFDVMLTPEGLAEIKTYADGIGPWKPQIVPLKITDWKDKNADGTPYKGSTPEAIDADADEPRSPTPTRPACSCMSSPSATRRNISRPTTTATPAGISQVLPARRRWRVYGFYKCRCDRTHRLSPRTGAMSHKAPLDRPPPMWRMVCSRRIHVGRRIEGRAVRFRENEQRSLASDFGASETFGRRL